MLRTITSKLKKKLLKKVIFNFHTKNIIKISKIYIIKNWSLSQRWPGPQSSSLLQFFATSSPSPGYSSQRLKKSNNIKLLKDILTFTQLAWCNVHHLVGNLRHFGIWLVLRWLAKYSLVKSRSVSWLIAPINYCFSKAQQQKLQIRNIKTMNNNSKTLN